MSISFGALDRVINLLVLVTSSASVRYIGPMDFFFFLFCSLNIRETIPALWSPHVQTFRMREGKKREKLTSTTGSSLV